MADPGSAPLRLKSVQIEPTTNCNLKCAGCNRTYREEQGTLEVKTMALETFRAIIANLPPGEICWLNGYGEPTLNAALPDFIPIAKEKFDRVYCISNALTRGPDFYRRMEAAGLDELHISVDSLDPAMADAVRSGTDTGKLKRRLREIRAALSIDIIINVVVSAKNLYDVPNTVAHLDEIGGFRVGFADFGAFAEEGYDYGDWFMDWETKQSFHRMIKPITETFTNVSFINTRFKMRRRKKTTARCDRPFLHPAVTVDGLLTPCCVELHDTGHYGETNVAMMTYEEAWASAPVSKWVSDYIEAEPEIFKECCLNPWRNEKDYKPWWERLMGAGVGAQDGTPAPASKTA